MAFNLLVSTYRHHEDDAQQELVDLLDYCGDNNPSSELTDTIGIILGQTNLNPFEFIKNIKKLVVSEPWRFRYILRVIPIEKVIRTDLAIIKSGVQELVPRIGENETFRITVEKRHTSLKSMEIISYIGNEIPHRVNLDNPDRVILVEIIGGLCGISILRKDDIFSSIIEKRNSSSTL